MTDSLWLHVLLAFVVSGAWVGSVTFAAGKFHSGIGGLIGGLPAISFISFLFIGLNQTSETASQATRVFPLGLAFTFLFLLVYALLAGLGFKIAMSVSLLAWFILSGVESYAGLNDLLVSVVTLVSVFTLSMYVFTVRLKLPYAEGVADEFSISSFLQRAIAGGMVIASAVYLGQMLGPSEGGIAAAFPAIFSLSLTFTYRSGGMTLSRSMTKPLMLSAMLVAFPYNILVGLLYPVLGLYVGTLSSVGGVAPLAFLAYLLIDNKKI